MSEQEKKEQEIMNQEMSQDEMDTVAGGRGIFACMLTKTNTASTGIRRGMAVQFASRTAPLAARKRWRTEAPAISTTPVMMNISDTWA